MFGRILNSRSQRRSREITQLDRIEAILNEDKNEIIETAIDEYTLELIEQGGIVMRTLVEKLKTAVL